MIKAWLDCMFPPFCEVCKEPCRTRLLCPNCWELCAPIDPKERCRHCFAEVEQEGICQRCRSDPILSIPRASVFETSPSTRRLCREAKEKPEAIAAFALFQWERLNWPMPDVVVPLPGALQIAKPFAAWLHRPYDRIFHRWNCDVESLEEDGILLLLSEKDSAMPLQKSIETLSGAFPKKIYALSLLTTLL